MKMKKVIAGVLASVVAVSAMATMAVSAATVNQKEEVIPFDLSEKGWETTHKMSAEFTSQDGFNLTAGTYTFLKDGTTDPVEMTVKISGKASVSDTILTREFKTDKNGVLEVKAGSAAEGEVSLGLWEANKINSIIFSKEVANALNDGDNYTKEQKAKDDADTKATFVVKDSNDFLKEAAATFTMAGAGSYKKADAAGIELDFTNTKAMSFNAIKGNLGYAVANAIGNKKGAQLVLTFKTDAELGSVDTDIPGKDWNFDKVDGSIKDLAIAPTVAGVWNGKVQGAANVDKGVATFDWDAIVEGSGLYTNGIGLINDILIAHKNGDNDDNDEVKLVLDKVEVKIPAKTVEDITLGEGVEETTPAPVETEASEEAPADTTAPVENPTTGNAPIALAVIPVAIVAAAIVAKKRG